MTIYMAMTSPMAAPLLARSTDGGAHFTVSDLSADLGAGWLRIIAVDPEDPARVLLRFLGLNDQSLALTTDGGVRVSKPVTIDGTFTSFVRLPSGTMLVGAMVEGSTVPALFRSRDRGASFEQVANAPSIRALSQRNGVAYAAADNFKDGFALGTSADEGETWQGLLRYNQVQGILPCLSSRCRAACQTEVDIGLWPQEVCGAAVTLDGGTGGAGPPDSGCGCGVGAGRSGDPVDAVLLVVAALAAIAAAGRRASRASGCSRSSSASASPARRRRWRDLLDDPLAAERDDVVAVRHPLDVAHDVGLVRVARRLVGPDPA